MFKNEDNSKFKFGQEVEVDGKKGKIEQIEKSRSGFITYSYAVRIDGELSWKWEKDIK